jgi:transposase
LANEIGLPSLLGKYSKEILSMVYAHCTDFKSVNNMPDWFQRTDLNFLLGLNNVTEDICLKAPDSLEAMDLTELQKQIFEKTIKKHKIYDKGILYDVTNTYLYGKKCPFGKLGHDKEGVKGRPLIQVGLGVTKEDGIPIFHKTFHGNIGDSKTLEDSITSFGDFKIKDGLIVFDRGISSKKNQVDIRKLKWKVICGLPLQQGLKKVLKPLINKPNFTKLNNRVKLSKTVFYVITKPYSIGEVKGKIIICFNEQKRKNAKEALYDEINEAENLLSEGKGIKESLNKYFDKNNKLMANKMEEALEFCGYSVIFTTSGHSNDEIVKIYFDKDVVEKAFQSLKGVTKLRPIRHWLYNRVVAHIFICYLSYLLLSLLRLKLKKLNLSPVEALSQLDTMYKIYLKDEKKGFEISRIVTLSKMQEKILKLISSEILKINKD